MMNYLTVHLDKSHIKSDFQCKHASLENYIKLQASKESKKSLARVYVLADNELNVLAYYTLSSAELPRESVPNNLLKHLPNTYSGYPAILLGRLAVTTPEIGKGLGGEILVDAIARCVEFSDGVGTRAIIVDPIDAEAANFYKKFSFQELPNSNRLIMHIDNAVREHYGLPPLLA